MVSVDDYWTVQNNVRGYRGGDGPAGAPGKSAYQIAVDNGFVGNEAAWLASLVGPEGEAGENGSNGSNGSAATVAVGTVSTGAPGSSATVTNAGTSSAAVLNFSIPQGDAGENGADGSDGAAATIAVGTVTTGAAGSSASVTNAGTSNAAVLNFTIPRGDQGGQGIQGIQGDVGPAGPAVISALTARSPAFGTAYQTQDASKPSFISAMIDTAYTVTVASTIADTVELRVGANQAQVAAGTGGSVAATFRTSVTGIALAIGLGIGQRGQLTAWVPSGWYWALRRTQGTAATITSATEQSLG